MGVILQVENISKQYRLGTVGTGSLAHDLNRWWHTVRGKEDPYLKIGEENDRSTTGSSDYVWALRDINFEVQQGEILGIIGKNGAGKSTLLKILSRVTAPTTGVIKTRGRIASLLEVGTGFHGELTGRENIYMNGAILGMTKREITAKLDEIIAFSGCERYIDTPVKRYSSGMTVRLGFAVAAHLEPDILVVDEVLAVGDAEFQKKAIGKMQDVSRSEGRTVLFVSHNMAAVKSLCTRGIVLENGKMAFTGTAEEGVDWYLNNQKQKSLSEIKIDDVNRNRLSNEKVAINNVFFTNIIGEKISNANINDDVFLNIIYEVKLDNLVLNLSVSVYSENEEYILSSPSGTDENWFNQKHPVGLYKSKCKISKSLLNERDYSFSVLIVESGRSVILQVDKLVELSYYDDGTNRYNYFGKWNGLVRPILEWDTSKL